jgi:ABC-type branched-subunit amino acid transport system substrate-binding protein
MATIDPVTGPRRALGAFLAIAVAVALAACETTVPASGGGAQAPAGVRTQNPAAVPPPARAMPVPPAPPTGNPTPGPAAVPATVPPAEQASLAAPATTSPAAEPPAAPAIRAKIGALLPLTGPSAALGAALLDAMNLALGDARGGIPVDFLPRDTGGTPEGARAAAASALEAGATILVGPVFGSEVPAVSVLARGANVPVLGLTNNATTAAPGVFVMGLLPQVQVDRLTSFARAKGARRFALVAPNDDHGRLVEAALRTAVAAGGGQLVAVERHGGDMPGMSAAVKRIAAAIDRIDALMIAGNEDTLLLSASFVPYHDIDAREKLVLVATVTWDDPRLPREVALYGAYLAAPLTQRREEFQRRFREAYKREAPRLAALGYDAAALAIAAIREAGEGPLVPVLTTPDGFEGYEGFFRLLPDGGNLRQLPILQLQRGGPRVVDDPGSAAN